MFCPKCGNSIDNNLKFCGACGCNLSEAMKASPQRPTANRPIPSRKKPVPVDTAKPKERLVGTGVNSKKWDIRNLTGGYELEYIENEKTRSTLSLIVAIIATILLVGVTAGITSNIKKSEPTTKHAYSSLTDDRDNKENREDRDEKNNPDGDNGDKEWFSKDKTTEAEEGEGGTVTSSSAEVTEVTTELTTEETVEGTSETEESTGETTEPIEKETSEVVEDETTEIASEWDATETDSESNTSAESSGHKLYGTILSKDTKAPIAGAILTLKTSPEVTVLSDENGYFEFVGVMEGKFPLFISCDGFIEYQDSFEINDDTTVGNIYLDSRQ